MPNWKGSFGGLFIPVPVPIYAKSCAQLWLIMGERCVPTKLMSLNAVTDSTGEQRQQWMGECLPDAHGLSQNTGEGHLLRPHCVREAPLASSPI